MSQYSRARARADYQSWNERKDQQDTTVKYFLQWAYLNFLIKNRFIDKFLTSFWTTLAKFFS